MTDVYRCDCCGTTYKTPEAAYHCEESHISVEKVRPVYLKGKAHPYAISVMLEDGVQCMFYRDPNGSWHME